MEFKGYCQSLQELSFEESTQINGGESAWYWIAYGVGLVVHFTNEVRDMNKDNIGIK